MILTTEEVVNLRQAQIVRDIRNSCRLYMTNDNRHITPEEQERFFQKAPYDSLYLYYEPNQAVVGYGMIKNRWGTLALYEEFRGLGYGTEIYQHLVSLEPALRLEIFSDNNASLIAALKSGFHIKSTNDKTITLVYGKN